MGMEVNQISLIANIYLNKIYKTAILTADKFLNLSRFVTQIKKIGFIL